MNKRVAACIVLLFAPVAVAATDLAQGGKLVEASKCEACHRGKVPGPVGAIYLRKDRLVSSWAKLKSQVAQCNTALNIGLFPEDEENIAAFLNATYYRFPVR